MNTETSHPKTLLEAVRYFADPDVCHKYMVDIKWPTGKIVCPKCGGEHVGEIKSRRMFQCKAKDCRKQFSTKVNTIFEDSPLGLDKWFVGVWCIANMKNGVSSHELGRTLGITQRAAWHMLHRIRVAMQTKSFKKISGEIESDETLLGGRLSNMHASRKKKFRKMGGFINKQIVHGILERGSELRARVVPNVKQPTLQAGIRENVEGGSTVYTDQLGSYRGLDPEFVHRMVDHSRAYVEGRIHVNGLENFWSLLKRTLKGTYVWCAPEHLQAYIDEQSHRFNNRKSNDAERFRAVMRRVIGRRLTYKSLTSREAVA